MSLRGSIPIVIPAEAGTYRSPISTKQIGGSAASSDEKALSRNDQW